MNCSIRKAITILQELETEKGIGLIEKKRQGLGKPNILYVKNFIVDREDTGYQEKYKETQDEEQQKENLFEQQFKDCENDNSRSARFDM